MYILEDKKGIIFNAKKKTVSIIATRCAIQTNFNEQTNTRQHIHRTQFESGWFWR